MDLIESHREKESHSGSSTAAKLQRIEATAYCLQRREAKAQSLQSAVHHRDREEIARCVCMHVRLKSAPMSVSLSLRSFLLPLVASENKSPLFLFRDFNSQESSLFLCFLSLSFSDSLAVVSLSSVSSSDMRSSCNQRNRCYQYSSGMVSQ